MATKTTPTLRRVGRCQLYERRIHLHSSCSRLRSAPLPPTAIPQIASTSGTAVACDGDTETILSDEVEASTSPSFSFYDAETLEDSFPSILRLVDSLSRVYQGNDPAAFCALA